MFWSAAYHAGGICIWWARNVRTVGTSACWLWFVCRCTFEADATSSNFADTFIHMHVREGYKCLKRGGRKRASTLLTATFHVVTRPSYLQSSYYPTRCDERGLQVYCVFFVGWSQTINSAFIVGSGPPSILLLHSFTRISSFLMVFNCLRTCYVRRGQKWRHQ